MKGDITFLGLIRRVVGSKILVELSSEIPSASPIINGRIYRLGQIGSFVRIPLGFLNLYGVVSMVGASEIVLPEDIDFTAVTGQRWLEIQLVGESYGRDGFERGVSVFPTIDDEVHIVTDEDLVIIYGTTKESMIEIGSLAASESLPAKIDVDKIVTRHAAIVGSTGSGKSNTVAGLLKSLSNGDYPNLQIVVIDTHGEYGEALKDRATVLSLGDATNPLYIPFWALSFSELMWFLVDRKDASESQQDIALRDIIYGLKKKSCPNLKSKVLDSEITVDSPIPFDIKQMWYDLYIKEKATLQEKDNWKKIAFKKDESGHEIKGQVRAPSIPPQFEPPGTSSNPPFWTTKGIGLTQYLNKMIGRFNDKRFDFLLEPKDYNGTNKDLNDLLDLWLNHDHSITILDLAGIPPEITDLVVGVLTRIIFEGMFWGRDLPGIGRQRPVLLVYEEAHSYLPKGGKAQFVSGYAGVSVRRVVKEGRKYGIGCIVVSQRPSELDETILSQCGTFFALRLSNSNDQARIKSTVPDSFEGLTSLLPALRTGEAIVLGEAVQIPSRIRLPLVEPRPKSDDPEPVKRWKEKRIENPPYDKAIIGWRSQKIMKYKKKGDENESRSSTVK
jgi:hypothetical protein